VDKFRRRHNSADLFGSYSNLTISCGPSLDYCGPSLDYCGPSLAYSGPGLDLI
jgi:hypothetical protein